MRRLRMGAAVAMATSLLVSGLGALPAAQAASNYENREDFIYQLDKTLGIKPVYPATPEFSDVPTTDPYYGYIEAAYQLGITNGIKPGLFGPALSITRAEAAKYLVIGYGANAIAQKITSTNFKDNASIPTALVGYVGAAAQLHLMQGFPNGDFYPNQDLTVTQEGYLLNHLLVAMSSVTLKLSASSTDVAPGQIVTLSAEGVTSTGASVPAPDVTYSVTGSNAAAALISGNTVAATTPGSYSVEGKSGGASGTITISVYGPASSLKILPPQNIVANGASSETVQVELVDATGNIVAGSSDKINLKTDSNAAVGLLNSSGTVDAANTTETASVVNGVATFSAQAGLVAGAVSNLSATDATNSSVASASASVTASPQVPTAISLTAASPYLSANLPGGQDAISAMVEDQTGNPMVSGAYTVSFSASGPGNFSGGATAAGVYYGPSKGSANATLDDVQGSTGTITVTASATGFTSATTTVTAVIAGVPAQIAISPAQTANADSSASYTVTVEDSHGYPAAWDGSVKLSTSDTSGAGSITPASGVLTFAGQSTASFSAADTIVGSYTLTATDAAGLLTGGTSALTVTAGPTAQLALSPRGIPWSYVLISNPKWDWTAQLEDDHGNPVHEAGVLVTFNISSFDGNNAGTVTVNGQAEPGTNNDLTVIASTNAEGAATASATALPYTGDAYRADAQVQSAYALSSVVDLSDHVANGAIQVIYTDSSSSPVTNFIANGTSYQGALQLTDVYGTVYNPSVPANCGFCQVMGDIVQVTASGTGSVSLSGSGVSGSNGSWTIVTDPYGQANFTVTGETAGSVTLTYQDLNTIGASPTISAVSVSPGQTTSSVGFFSGGSQVTSSAPLTVAAGQYAEVTVSSLDQGGNIIPAPAPTPVTFTVNGGTGSIRNLPSGPNEPQAVTIQFGQMGASFYFINTTTAAESVWFGGSAGVIAITSPGTVTATQASQPYSLTWTLTSSGTPLPGVPVKFAVTATNGSALAQISSTTGTTNSLGQITITATTPSSWSSGDINSVTLSTEGATPQSSSATLTDAIPTSITSNADGGMSNPAGSTQPITFTVKTGAGTAVPAGIAVTVSTTAGGSNAGTWGISSTAGGAAQSSLSLTTDASGQVSAFVTDTKAGDTGTLTATAAGFPSATDTTGTVSIGAGPVGQIVTGASGSYTAGSNNPITFTVEDSAGNPVGAGTSVSLSSSGALSWGFSTTSGGASTTNATESTDASGQVTVYLTDTAAGDSGTVTATVGSVSGSTGSMTIVAGPAYNIQIAGAALEAYNSYPVSTWYPNYYAYTWQVAVTDQYGNPVYGLQGSYNGDVSGVYQYSPDFSITDTTVLGHAGYSSWIFTSSQTFTNVYYITGLSFSPITSTDTVVIQTGSASATSTF